MKIALISCHSIRYMPYLSLYKRAVEEVGAEYIIINEHEISDILDEHQIVYRGDYKSGFYNKLKNYRKWRKFVIQTVKDYKVDKIVFLTPWAPIKLFDVCSGKWRKNYILDIRDYSSESVSWFRALEHKIISNALFTVISSKGFLRWLPSNEKYHVAHNMPAFYKEKDECIAFQKDKIKIGYIGLVSYFPQNCALVSKTKDSNYEMIFSGAIEKSCPIETFCEEQHFDHVRFTGPYNNSEKESLYRDIDFINAVYGNHTEVVCSALPNKLYDCLIYKIPMIVSSGTYLAEIVENNGLGIAIDTEKENFLEKIDGYVKCFDRESFVKNCKNLLQLCKDEQDETVNAIKKVFCQ